MSRIRTVAVHDVVSAAFPRPIRPGDEVGMAVGKAIDAALSHYSYQWAQGRRPTYTSLRTLAAEIFDDEMAEAENPITPEERDRQLAAVSAVVQTFRESPLLGLPRPKTRLIVINGRVGVYAQPDYWDGLGRFYEMKSYFARPIPPDIRLQVELFQCAFRGFRAFLAWFDRHSAPVSFTLEELPPLTADEAQRILGMAYRTAIASGIDKVLEYVDSPQVHWEIPEPGPVDAAEPTPAPTDP